MAAESKAYEITYTGPGVASELWGGTQANFMVDRPHSPARESAVLLNDAAARYLATELGVENTAEFRETAARFAGRAWIERTHRLYNRVEVLTMLSAADLREYPEAVEAVRAALASRANMLVERSAPQH